MSGLSNALDRLYEVLARIDAGRDLSQVLQAVADGVVEVSGFTLAVISVPRGTSEMEVVAVSGPDPGLAGLVGDRFPRRMLEDSWERGESSGRFVFVSEAAALDDQDGPGVLIPDFEPLDHPDAWLRLDEMSAALRGPGGELLGAIAVDVPADGLRPKADVVEVMEVFAMQAALAIHQALQREQLREELFLRGMVNELFAASGEGSLEQVLETVLPAVRSDMAVADVWVEAFPHEDQTSHARRAWGGESIPTVRAALSALGQRLAEQARRTESPIVYGVDVEGDPHLGPEDTRAALVRGLVADGASRVLLAPLTQGRQTIGQVALVRVDGRPWSGVEREVVLDVGRALSWALMRGRALDVVAAAEASVERERDERARMLTSLARQVRGAMSVVDDHLRTEDLPSDHPARQAMTEFWILFGRVSRMTGYQADTGAAVRGQVDVADVLRSVWPRFTERARESGVNLLPLERAPGARPVALTDRSQLEWLLLVLGEDLLEVTPRAGSVRVVVVRRGDRVIVSLQASGTNEVHNDETTETEAVPTWWFTGAQALVGKLGGALGVREGPLGRRVVTLDLPTS